MNDTTWQEEDGRLLKDLRTAAGIDLHEFARSASISVAQLKQLEDGGHELFYSQTIKFQLGRKLLRKLGADVVRTEPEEQGQTPSLFGFTPAQAPAPSLEEALTAAPTPDLPEPITTQPASPKKAVVALASLGILAMVGVFAAQLLTPSERPVLATTPEPTPAVVSASPAPVEAPAPLNTSTSVGSDSALPVSAASSLTPVPAASATELVAACDWSSPSGNSFMPRGMDKPSTYVHLVANADAHICVQDRNKKTTEVQLKAGEKITVRGSAPWRIQTQQWADVGVFFQGYRMPVPATANLVTLNPRTEPLAEPTAQSN